MPLLQPLAWPSPRALSHALWHGRSVRAQLLVVFIVIDLIAGLVAGAVTILQARAPNGHATARATGREATATPAAEAVASDFRIGR